LTFFLVRFWAFLGEGSSKTPLKYFGKKSVSKTFPKISTKISMSVFPRLFLFFAFSGVFQRREFKDTTKNVLQKNRVEKFLQKIRPEIQNRRFLDFFLLAAPCVRALTRGTMGNRAGRPPATGGAT
jgi:hypothetical protein